QTPLRAVLGDARYEALKAGEGGFPHYLGDELLAPDFALQARNGEVWKLSDHRGELIVLNFWSVTCPPCVKELPTLERLARKLKGREDIEVVAISADSSWEQAGTVLPEET